MPDCRWYSIVNRRELDWVLAHVPPSDRPEVETQVRELFLKGPRAPGVRVLRDFELDERSSFVVSIWADRVDLWFVADDRDCVLTLRLALPSGRASRS